MSKTAINISLKSQLNDTSFSPNHVYLNFNGKDVNHIILNTIRRTILEDIPCYGFNVKNISISKNSSVYNNDYMRNRIENFPIFSVDAGLNLEEYNTLRKYTRGRKLDVEQVNEEEEEEEEESDVTIYCKVSNSDELIKSVTSEDMEFYLKGKKVKSYFPNPILLIKLKKDEEFEFSAKSDKGIAMNHSRYATVGMCCYEMNKDNDFTLKVEPRGQINMVDIFDRAFEIIKYRLNLIMTKVMKTKFTNDNHGKIVLNNEDHTYGTVLAKGLQEHKNIEFAGYRMDHLLIRDVTIEYVTNGGKSINEILKEVITDFIKTFENIQSQISKIKLK